MRIVGIYLLEIKRMNSSRLLFRCTLVFALSSSYAFGQQTLSQSTFLDKLQGGWVAQMAGVAWGASTEAQWKDQIIPPADVPQWQPDWINDGFNQDDLYVEIPFVDTMNQHGIGATWTDYGNTFRDTTFELWAANKIGRDNLLAGIPAPDSGHPLNNIRYSNIDWQIESNYAGAISPGLPNAAAALAWRGGHLMTWGRGVSGGVAFAAMQARAYTATDMTQVINAGRDVLPAGSRYHNMIADMIDWYEADSDKTTFEDTWQLAQDKYGTAAWIDARANGAWVMLGLLYGREDIETAMRIAMRGGDDSDCNPSTVGAIVGTYLGWSQIPAKFKEQLDQTEQNFYGTDYNFDQLVNTTEQLAAQVVRDQGGWMTSGADPLWTIPDTVAHPVILESWSTASNDAPSITAQVVPGDNTRTFSFSAQATDSHGVSDYVWYFGDTAYAHGSDLTHTYVSDGTFEAVIYVCDTTGNTNWSAVSVTVTTLLADVNLDGAINNNDIAPFITTLSQAANAPYRSEADCNADGLVNNLDIAPFITELISGGATVPEPSASLIVLAVCLPNLLRRSPSPRRPTSI